MNLAKLFIPSIILSIIGVIAKLQGDYTTLSNIALLISTILFISGIILLIIRYKKTKYSFYYPP